MGPSGLTSPDLGRKIFFNGLVFLAIMLAMSGTIVWYVSHVAGDAEAILQGLEESVATHGEAVALERKAAAEREALRTHAPAIRAAADHAVQASRDALTAREQAALARARAASADMRPRIQAAWRLGGLRALLAIGFFVFLGWRQYRLIANAFEAYIAELHAQGRRVDELAKALARQNEELERRVVDRTRELAEARDQAQRSNDAKSAFLANFSHELRTPLNAIIGYSELVAEELASEAFPGKQDTMADVERIRGAGRHLLGLIDDVLDLAKVEAGKLVATFEPVDMRALVADVADMTRPLAAKGLNDLVLTIDAPVEPVVTDPKLLRQALYNLVANACKFTEHGRIELAVRQTDGQLLFLVTDTGIGMSADQVARLFQEYAQADASITRKYGGTGLGLAITQRFCRLLGGEVGVESELGRGSTFTLRVPLVAPVAV